MIHSMTAFARVQKQLESGHLIWEVRSVNHRYLDVSFRMPEFLRFIETPLRASLRDKVHRGKLECQLRYQDTSEDKQSMLINKGMVNSLIDLSHELATIHHVANDLSVSTILSWPGVIQTNQLDTDVLGEDAIQLFKDAITQLTQTRAVEGQALKSHVTGRLDVLQQAVNEAKSIIASQSTLAKEKLLSRLKTIQIEVPEARVEQEIALILAKLDVTEEIDRLATHIQEVNRCLNSDIVAGRRLDFLMQELNREANTLSSKSDTVNLTQVAVEMKVLIEQMREQIQNIE